MSEIKEKFVPNVSRLQESTTSAEQERNKKVGTL